MRVPALVPFCLAFLGSLAGVQALERTWPAWAALPACLALASMRRTRPLVLPALAGAALGAARAPAMLPPPQRAPLTARAVPVAVQGRVSGPARMLQRGCLVPLEGRPPLRLPPETDPPLPGARIRALGRLEAGGRRIEVPGSAALEILQPSPPAYLPALLERLRRGVRRRLSTGLDPVAAAHLRALILGERTLSPEQRRRMARTGTLHLFAVSGLHLAVFLSLLRRACGPRPGALLLLLALYAGLTGFRSPVARAYLLGGLVLLGGRLGRLSRPLPHLLLVITLILVWDPRSVHTLGFRLSFASYAGIQLLALPRLRAAAEDPFRHLRSGSLHGLRRYLHHGTLVATAAFLGSLPVVATAFHRVAWVAIPGSLLLVPAVPLLLVLGSLLALAPGLPPAVQAAELVVEALARGVALLDAVPLGNLDLPRPHPAGCALAVLGLLLLARGIARGAGRRRRAAALLLLAGLLLPVTPPRGILMVPARRGLAALVTGSAGRYLVDCGPEGARVADRLLHMGVGRLDGVFISHLDEDHAGGLPAVKRRLHPPWIACARHSGEAAPLPGARLLQAGDGLAGGGQRLRVLWPPPGCTLPDRNDRSLVLAVRACNRRALLLGDLETRGLRALLERGELPPADIVAVPHHGARNDALPQALLQSAPDRAWISARPGFPDEATLLVLAWAGVPVELTSLGGTLRAGELP